MSTQHDSEGFMSTPLEGEVLDAKITIIRTVRTMRFDSERQTKSINVLKQISLELPELDERVLILGAIHQKALHH